MFQWRTTSPSEFSMQEPDQFPIKKVQGSGIGPALSGLPIISPNMKPPGFSGGPTKFDNSGIDMKTPFREPLVAVVKGSNCASYQKFKTFGLGMQVPCGIHSQIPKKNPVRQTS